MSSQRRHRATLVCILHTECNDKTKPSSIPIFVRIAEEGKRADNGKTDTIFQGSSSRVLRYGRAQKFFRSPAWQLSPSSLHNTFEIVSANSTSQKLHLYASFKTEHVIQCTSERINLCFR